MKNWVRSTTSKDDPVDWVERYTAGLSHEPLFNENHPGNLIAGFAGGAPQENKPNTYMEACVVVSVFQAFVAEVYPQAKLAHFPMSFWDTTKIQALEQEIIKRHSLKLGGIGDEKNHLEHIHLEFALKPGRFNELNTDQKVQLQTSYMHMMYLTIETSADLLTAHSKLNEEQLGR